MGIIIFLAVMIAAFALERALYGKRWDEDIDVKLSFEKDNLYEGESTILEETVTYAGRLPLPWLHVKFQASRDLAFKNSINSSVTDYYYCDDVYYIKPGEKITRRLDVTCVKRGVQRVRSIDLLSMDMLVSKRLLSNRGGCSQVIVYPKLVDVSGIIPAVRPVPGEYLTKKNIIEDPFMFSGIREYMEGDSPRAVNWRATARSDRLLVNTYDSTTSMRAVIWLNLDSGSEWCDKLMAEECIRIAASLMQTYTERGTQVSMLCNGQDYFSGEEIYITSGCSQAQAATALTALARVDLECGVRAMEEMLLERGVRVMQEDQVIIVSAFVSAPMLELAESTGQTCSYKPLWVVPVMRDDKAGKAKLQGMKNCLIWEVERDA